MSALDLPMTEAEAQQVTARIKLLLKTITETTEKTISLIERAEAGRAWQILGYPSWTAYVAAEFAGALSDLARAERVPITAKLSMTGMSVRAIASVTGTSVGTAHHDVVQGGVQSLNTSVMTTTGADGKTYLRNGRPTAAAMAELADVVPPVRPKSRRRPLPDAYRDAVYDLQKAVERLARLSADDRFGRNAEELYHRTSGTLQRLAESLHDDVRMPLVRGGQPADRDVDDLGDGGA